MVRTRVLSLLMLATVALAAGCRSGSRHEAPGANAVDSHTAETRPSQNLPPGPLDTEVTRAERERLVRAIERRESLDPRVIEALRAVPRHLFVPDSLLNVAYEDGPLPIGEGQTISQPTVVGMMTDALKLKGDEIILEVGTGSGYQAAVLSRLCRRVETIEIIPSLAEAAKRALKRAGYGNVNVHVGDGYAGLPNLAPFEGIIITAAPPTIPQALIQQLKDGGRLVVPVGPSGGIQELLLVQKLGGEIKRTELGAVRFVPMVPGSSRSPWPY